MVMKSTLYKLGASLARYGLQALLLVALLLGGIGISPAAPGTAAQDTPVAESSVQGEGATAVVTEDETAGDEVLSDEVLAARLEAVILEEKILKHGIQTVIEIPASQDTFISSNKPNQNFGRSTTLGLGYNNTGQNYGAMRTFLHFDAARYVPAGAQINNAYVKVYESSFAPGGDSPMRVEGRHLLDPWHEDLVTWNSHQPHWGTVTGDSWVPAMIGWVTEDVTALVREWHSNSHANNGIILMGDEMPSLARQRYFYSLNANNGKPPHLVVDYTYSTDTTPPVASVHPLPAWSQSSFVVSWSGTDPGGSGIAYFDIEYSENAGHWTHWISHATYPSATFVGGQNGALYQFRARAVDNSGNIQPWGPAQAQTRVDSVTPLASVHDLPPYTFTQAFWVSWSGADNAGGSGIKNYDIQFRWNNGAWHTWLVGTTLITAQFTGAQDDGLYEFRARATDVGGNVQPFGDAQAWTNVETSGPISLITPFDPAKTSNDSFPVTWTGHTAPTLSIAYFDVRYRFNNDSWIAWLNQTQLSGATFTDLNPQDGVYGFEVRAMDSLGRLEEWTGVPEASIAVDRYPPHITPRLYLPIVAQNE